MRRLLLATAMLLAAAAARADGLALRRVMLSAAGVGYFEYEGEADGAAQFTLDVPRARMDDVLASLIVLDDAGHVGGVTMPGADATRAAFAGLPFGPGALATPRDLLNALRGQELAVRGPRPMTGIVLRAETTTEPSGTHGGVPRTRVTLLTQAGLQQFVLEDAESVAPVDAGLRERMSAALVAARGTAAAEERRLTLRVPGTGRRTVHVGYVAEAPLWKATYRLELPAHPGDKARLQAWAVLENDSVSDWDGVDLTLQYGNPVTFRQALYRSYYVSRPEVPVEVLGRILPGVDTRAANLPMAKAARMEAPMAMAAAAAPPQMATPEPAPPPSEGAESTIFHLPGPVTLPAGQSATLPILDREVPAGRVAWAQEGRAHPLAAVRLVNDTGGSLPAGVLTLYDGADAASFAGDARLGGLPRGESRLLAFAEDLRTTTDWQEAETATLIGVTAANGVLHLERRLRWTEAVTLSAPVAESRDLLVEIGKRPGTLSAEDGAKPAEQTAAAWRFLVALKPGETRTLTVHVDRTTVEAVALIGDEATLAAVLATEGLDPRTRAALEHIADLRATLAARRAEHDHLTARRGEVERDEDRLRRNLAAVPVTDALHGRLVQSLAADEATLAELASQIVTASQAVQAAEATLQQAVQHLTL